MAPSPDFRKLFDPFVSLKYVTEAADLTLWYNGLDGPPTGKRLRSLAKIRGISEAVRFLGSTLVTLWGRRDRAARRWRSHFVQHLRRRTGQLETEVADLRRQFSARPDGEALPPEARQLWEGVATLLPIVRRRIGTRPLQARGRDLRDAIASLSGALDAALKDEAKGRSLAEQLAQIERWAKSKEGGEAPDIAQLWARAIARNWQRYGAARANPIDPQTKEALVLYVLPSVVRRARLPCRVRVGGRYYRRVTRLDEDARDIMIKPRIDLPMALLILWIKNESIAAAERILADPSRLLDARGATAFDTEAGERSVGKFLAAQWGEKETAADEAHDHDLLGAIDDSLTLAAKFEPYYKCLSKAPAQQLLLRTWVDLRSSERTLRQAARRVGISYGNAKVQWANLWKTLEAQGLKRPRLPLRKWLVEC